jgi:chromosome segregation ATPase
LGLNVSVDLSLPLNAIGRPLQESIRELRRGYQSVSECLEQALADCEQRGSELADCRRQLAEARRSLSECERQIAERTRNETELTNRTSAIKKQLDAKSAELTQANERILRVQGECTQSQQRLEMAAEQTEHLRAQIARLEADHRESRDELSQLRGQFAPLAEAAAEAVRLRGELAAAQTDLIRLREQLSSPGDGGELQTQLAAFQTERQQLQSELDLLRHKATELSETLADQKRQADTERDRWSEELRHMRQIMERQTDAWAQRAAQASDDAAALAATRERLAVAEAAIVQGREGLQLQVEQCDQLRTEIQRLESQREAARDELSQLRGQLGPLAENAAEAARLRGELTSAQGEIARLRDEVSSPAEAAELQDQLCTMQNERQQLQGELESLRRRAADLAEALDEQKRLSLSERDQWSEELRHLRESLDRQATAWAERGDQTALDAQALATARERAIQAEAEILQSHDRLQMQVDQNAQLREEIQRLESHREAARDELSQLRGQFGPLAENAAEAARLRGELLAAQSEIERLRLQVTSPAEAAELQQELFSNQAERQRLQGELEAVRQRAADLSEQLAEQSRLAAAERDAWSEELRHLRETLERQSETWAARVGQSTDESATAAELASVAARLNAAQTELALSRQQLELRSAENEKLRNEIAQLEATRNAAQAELETLRNQAPPAVDLGASESLRAELANANAEIERLTAQIAEGADTTAIEERLVAAESERQQLENELDLLRHRGAELIEQLAEQKRTAASERESWSEELRQLRKAVEMQSEALAQRGGTIPVMSAPSTPTVVDAPRAPQSNGSRADDSVLGSVMEQFESLQKNKVRKLTTPKR